MLALVFSGRSFRTRRRVAALARSLLGGLGGRRHHVLRQEGHALHNPARTVNLPGISLTSWAFRTALEWQQYSDRILGVTAGLCVPGEPAPCALSRGAENDRSGGDDDGRDIGRDMPEPMAGVLPSDEGGCVLVLCDIGCERPACGTLWRACLWAGRSFIIVYISKELSTYPSPNRAVPSLPRGTGSAPVARLRAARDPPDRRDQGCLGRNCLQTTCRRHRHRTVFVCRRSSSSSGRSGSSTGCSASAGGSTCMGRSFARSSGPSRRRTSRQRQSRVVYTG